ncbi:beta-eudesmol synthase-like isoform X1 [Phalaenopsis equestris]|uniref:beta-eudesmol synthase-like isoform X1 n=1 Tax=Phalaenopsis equestris TaxID=78828 RepID=UPI0009E5F309|nr:beta-eudesmol synthase-like isoform X1 [Phalaenopsis equestris]
MEIQPSSQLGLEEVERQSVDYHPSIWEDFFIKNPPVSQEKLVMAFVKLRNDELKTEVRKMLVDATDTLQSLELIDRIQRLGVAYHFEKEINEQLLRIHNTYFDSNDLYAVALHFRILRQQRYYISCDVFEKFCEEKGEFRCSLSSNVNALLSLYEAAYLSLPGEEILDKAKIFSKPLLKTSLCNLEKHLAMMVSAALDVPLVRRVDRPRTKLYLSIYKNDSLFNKLLLDFAKLDFFILQTLYQEEVRSLSIWWKDLGLAKCFPFSRDRIVELSFWLISVHHEPFLSRVRNMLTKLLALLSLTDDIYDNYGTVEELELFTNVIKSWEIEAVSMLPKYMQPCFLAFHKTINEFERELEQEQYSFRVQYLIEEIKKMAQAYYEEAKWSSELYVPKLKDQLKASLATAGHSVISCASYMAMREDIPENLFEWVTSMPAIMTSSSLIGRVMNDLASCEFDQSKGQVASTVQCYMVEHKSSKEEARMKLMEMVEEGWKIINREFMFSTISIALIQTIINITNFNVLVYKDKDHYTNSNTIMKDYIMDVLVETVELDL